MSVYLFTSSFFCREVFMCDMNLANVEVTSIYIHGQFGRIPLPGLLLMEKILHHLGCIKHCKE